MGDLMQGKRGLIMGVANHNSIAWGAAKALHEHGAEIALTYQGEAFGRRVRPLADEIGCKLVLPCDVEDVSTLDSVFETLKQEWGGIDFVLHAIAFSDKSELKGLYADTTRDNFTRTMLISCFSFTEVAKRAAAIMENGGSMVTMTYGGAVKVMPNYNVMGVAKAALEASVRYLAADFGPRNIRVNAVSAGPVRTLAGAGVSDARLMFNYQRRNAPMRRNTTIEEVGGAVLYLMSELANGVTGEIHYVDSGYNIMSMPALDELKAQEQRKAIVEGEESLDTGK
ncbi:enoyl-ACP reductase FabI [Jiella sp. M17.18]|uniref:enoyl-ACP reductase FabI n=1 Tax=Jiella sp. M17.18 TaxID=3234247 RepID=UPI0034DDE9EE